MTLGAKIRIFCAVGSAVLGVQSTAWAAGIGFPLVCDGRDARAAAHGLLAPTEDAQQLQADTASAEIAIARIADLRRALLAGEPLEAPYATPARFERLSREAKDPVTAELFRRTALDQFARNHLTAAATKTGWAAGLSDGAVRLAYAVAASQDWCGIDADNTRWLRAQIAARGWFKRSTDGDAADSAAFLLVQHADQDRPFQRQVLQALEPLLATKETRPANYALLFDRVAVGDGRPQRYGSQGRCTGPGVWTAFPVEAPESVDQRRSEMGLPPMAAYRQGFVRLCP